MTLLRNILLTALLSLLIFLGLGWWQERQGTQVARSQAGQEAAQQLLKLQLNDMEQQIQALQQWQGQLLVINLWASWCPPCRAEMPGFARLQGKYAGQQVQFIGLAFDSPEQVRHFIQDHPVNYPLLIADEPVMALFRKLGNHAGALPYTLIIDRHGRPVRARQGYWPETLLDQTLQELLRSAYRSAP